MPPHRVGPFEILSVIGRGGVGTVYRARHSGSGALAAVKVLGPSPAVDATAARRLAREYEVLRSLDHPNVVRVYEAGVAEGYSYLAMELVEGLDLRTYLSPTLDEASSFAALRAAEVTADTALSGSTGEPGPAAIRALAAMMDEPETEEIRPPLPHALAGPGEHARSVAPPLPPEVCAALNRPARVGRLRMAITEVADALRYVHGRGLVHRDLKPSNIMVDDSRRARLMDFGLVKSATDADESLTQTGRVVGTYRYMSPEQAQGLPVDARSDLYSLGVILYELLAGSPPFTAQEPVELWREILHLRPTPVEQLNAGADRTLCALALRLLAKDPAARCQSAGEVIAILASAAPTLRW